MTLHRLAILAFTTLCATACGSGGAGDKAPDFQIPEPVDIAPAAILDLSHWMLTLPVDAEGGTAGPAAHITTEELLGGYRSDWFQATQSDSTEGVTFWAPVTGTPTTHSKYARSELREMRDPSNASVNWSVADTARMEATLRVNQTPRSNGKVIVGQILGYNGTDPNISELMKLIFEYNHNERAAVLYALVMDNPYPGSPAQRIELTRSLRLNHPFSYTIAVKDRSVHVSTGSASGSAPITTEWDGVGVFFRAGVTLQATGSDASDGGRVTFERLRVIH